MNPCNECGHPGLSTPWTACPGCREWVASVKRWLYRQRRERLFSERG
jgi:hypothetical protein